MQVHTTDILWVVLVHSKDATDSPTNVGVYRACVPLSEGRVHDIYRAPELCG